MRSKYLPWHTAGDPPKKVRCPDCPRVGAVDARIRELEILLEKVERERNEWREMARTYKRVVYESRS